MNARLMRPAAVWTLLLLVLSPLPSCQTTAPGDDATATAITAAERALQVSDGAYATAMQWYFMPGNVQRLSPSQKEIFEKLRVGYGPAYQAVQNGITTLRAGKAHDLTKELAALQGLIGDVDAVIGLFIRPMPNVP